jgi:uncharacterized DUF497 family protein
LSGTTPTSTTSSDTGSPDEAEEVFDDRRRQGFPVYQVDQERRFGILGATQDGRILALVFVRRGDRIRIFSARDATPVERRRYRR